MKRLLISLLLLATFLPVRTAFAADPPATQSTPIVCQTARDLLFALATARKIPNTIIDLQPIEYKFSTELNIQGEGTTIRGNGATIVTTAIFNAKINPVTNSAFQGTAIVIKPLLGRAVPFANQKDGLYFNPAGTCESLNKAAGGSFQKFYEKAPTQDAAPPLLAKYELFASYLVPARNITLQDLKIRYANVGCDSGLYVFYAQNVVIRRITVLNKPADLGKGGGPGDLWSDGSQNVTFDSCTGPTYIELNSSTNCRVTKCTVGGVTFEEMSRFCSVNNCTLNNCRTNDLLCADITFDSNTFTGTGDNIGALWGGTRIVFKNNTCAGNVWLGKETRECTVSGNKGPAFLNYAEAAAGNSVSK